MKGWLRARALRLLWWVGERRRFRALDVAVQLLDKGQVAVLDYRVSGRRRYTEAQPHPELDALFAAGAERYRATLESFLAYRDRLLAIPLEPSSPAEPHWLSEWQPGLDCVALYSFIAAGPARYVEIGSGVSTAFARRAKDDCGLTTELISIDPQPRLEIDALCDRVVRNRLEDADLSLFGELERGDVVFFDGTHRVFTDSDATVFVLEVLPRLPQGVLVGVHDVWLPYDYPEAFANRYYSEQYLLAAWLLGRSKPEEIKLPAAYVSEHPELAEVLAPLWDDPRLAGVQRWGGSLWLET